MTAHQQVRQVFEDLGADIDKQWRERDCNDLAFARIAEQALTSHAVHEKIDYLDIVSWLNREPRLPRQYSMDANFGQPPITVYAGDGWYIEVLFWLEATTSVHRHAFSGAFQVFHGSSIEATWSFEREQQVSPRLAFGLVENQSVRLLETGAVQRIDPGAHLIHSVFHLEQPSVSIVVRTELISNHKPQFTYIRPHIEFDEWDPPDSIVRRLQGLSMLWSLQHPSYDEEVREVLRRADLHSALMVLENDLALTRDFERQLGFHAELRERYGHLADYILASARVRMLQALVGAKRALLTDPEHRYFLAVAMNASTPSAALDLVRMRHPDRDPVDAVVSWVAELAGPRADGERIFDEAEIGELALSALRQRLVQVHGGDDARELDEQSATVASALEESPLIRPFLRAD